MFFRNCLKQRGKDVQRLLFVHLPIMALLVALLLPRPAAAIEPSLVFDAGTGEVLLRHRAGDLWHPASLTKLMTSYVAFQAVRDGRVSLNTRLRMSKRAAKEPPSKIGYKPGTRFSLDFALRVLIVRSANDIAVALGEGVAGSHEKFVAEMNHHAKRLGMSSTHFVNPHGLHHKDQVTTARDMGVLAAALFRDFPEYAYFFSLKDVKVGKKRLSNRNKLLKTMPGADGMKTGFICPAGFNLVASATRNNRRLIAVVLGRRSGATRNEYTQQLLEGTYARSRRGKVKITEIVNTGKAPINMRQNVCNTDGITLTSPAELKGWGVSLGRFKDRRQALATIDSRLLLNAGILKSGQRGISRVPFSKEHVAVLWNLKRSEGQAFCQALHQHNEHCELVSPTTFTHLSREAQKEAQQKTVKKKAKTTKKKTKKTRKKKTKPAAQTQDNTVSVKPEQVTKKQPKGLKRVLPSAFKKIDASGKKPNAIPEP